MEEKSHFPAITFALAAMVSEFQIQKSPIPRFDTDYICMYNI